MGWLLQLLGVDPIGKIIDGLNAAYKAKLTAQNDADRITADVTIQRLQALLDQQHTAASIVTTGMSHKAFWIPWLIAAVPTAAWFGWGMLDSLCNGALPDAAALPPQLKEYADIVFQNIFYVGGGVAGLGAIANAIGGRK
ncbi:MULTISPECIES: hypothetical protein [unclassified Mesorhizobium]|uniref:hypothetical protein n=1 Tax=unclassified Mesorhizobium TaxID=325217 RepID=UPI000FCCBC7C|nr:MULTISPECIES: hypothetical protein [unclassified Mesorhizobium]TGP25911.1 hypothetical protein EN875_034380 [Mesorhizobium sp. M2D.F.Ca.ET.232.01.1.1]TGQ23863.1 hypothetical protein EN863_064700 [Mesorhizobium sp. M00.F.Ca.ET.220.01.1.1]TGT95864.1 hypothetical protein EN806_53805 [bacterium M00.F.Ca.ET.163.01.1.1]